MNHLPLIKFGHNWNGKLFCKCFTTIRPRNEKYQVGHQYRIQLDEQEIGPGIIRTITNITLAQLTNNMAYLDTGYNREYAQKVLLTMYKNKGFNWDTQLFSFLLIEMTEKTHQPSNDLLFGTYRVVKEEPQPAPVQKIGTLFTKQSA